MALPTTPAAPDRIGAADADSARVSVRSPGPAASAVTVPLRVNTKPTILMNAVYVMRVAEIQGG